MNKVKNQFPQRKRGSADNIFKNPVYVQELEALQYQHNDEMGMMKEEIELLSKQLDDFVMRQAMENDKSKDLRARLATFQEEKTGLEKVTLMQEGKINELVKKLADVKKRCTTLNSTLIESEKLNTEMTKKLNEYSELKRCNETKIKNLSKEKEKLEIQSQNLEEKLQMHEAKFDLLLNKQSDDMKFEKRNLQNENINLKSQLKSIQDELDRMKSEMKNQEKNLNVVEENRALKLQVEKQNDRCRQLEREVQNVKKVETKQRGETLENLEARLLKKSADYTALTVWKDTLQNRINLLEEQSKNLNEQQVIHEEKCQCLEIEVENLTKQRVEYEKQKALTAAIEEQMCTLTKQREGSKQDTDTLQTELENYRTEHEKQREVILELEMNLERSFAENLMLVQRYKTLQTKMMKIQYQESNDIMLTMQKQTEDLTQEVTRLKQLLKEVEELRSQEKITLRDELQNMRERSKQERRSYESVKTQLQTSFNLTKNRIENELILDQEKDRTYKVLINEKAELQLRILSLEEASSESDRLLQCKLHEANYLRNENKELRMDNHLLNQQIKSTHLCHQNIFIAKSFHPRTISADSTFQTPWTNKNLFSHAAENNNKVT